MNIIDNRILNPLSKETYTEKHHIVPKSLGGIDENINFVFLNAREHFICHCLLTKFVKNQGKYKMICAFDAMKMKSKGQSRYMNSRLFETNKIKRSEIMSKNMIGRKWSGMSGKTHSKTWKDNHKTFMKSWKQNPFHEKFFGYENHKTFNIQIYNENDILVKELSSFELKKFCKEINLPFETAKNSYQNDGKLIYYKPSKKARISKENLENFKDWFIIKI